MTENSDVYISVQRCRCVLNTVNILARSESDCVFSLGFRSRIRSISCTTQSSFPWDFFSKENIFVSSGAVAAWTSFKCLQTAEALCFF